MNRTVNLLGKLIVSLVAMGPGFGAGAGAQDPVPAQPPAAELLPAGPGKAAFTPARKTSFDEVTRQLDAGGDVFLYLATDRWLAALSTNVSQLRDVLEHLPNVPAAGHQQIDLGFRMLSDVISRSGLEGLSGVGLSGAQITQELHRSKLVVHHNPGQGQGLLWNLAGRPAHPLRAMEMLPKTTALALFGDLDARGAWTFIERTVSDSGEAGLAAGLHAWQQRFEQAAKLSWTNLLASFGGEAGIILTLDDSRKITLPLGPQPLELPEPGLIVAVKINDDTLFERVSQEMKANPQTRAQRGGRPQVVRHAAAPAAAGAVATDSGQQRRLLFCRDLAGVGPRGARRAQRQDPGPGRIG